MHCLSQTGARTGAPSAHKYRRHPFHHRSCSEIATTTSPPVSPSPCNGEGDKTVNGLNG